MPTKNKQPASPFRAHHVAIGYLVAAAAVLMISNTLRHDSLRDTQVARQDTTARAVILSAPTNNTTVSGMVSVDGHATGDGAVSKMQLYIDGSLVGADTSAPYGFAFDSSKYRNGVHAIQLRARGDAGDQGTSATTNIIVKNVSAASSGANASGGSTTVTTTPKAPATRISAAPSANTMPVPVKDVVVVTPTVAGASIQVSVDGNTVAGDSVDTKMLTNGRHKLIVTENGATATHFIAVHNPALTAVRNLLRTSPVLSVAASIGVLGLVALLFVGRHFLARRE